MRPISGSPGSPTSGTVSPSEIPNPRAVVGGDRRLVDGHVVDRLRPDVVARRDRRPSAAGRRRSGCGRRPPPGSGAGRRPGRWSPSARGTGRSPPGCPAADHERADRRRARWRRARRRPRAPAAAGRRRDPRRTSRFWSSTMFRAATGAAATSARTASSARLASTRGASAATSAVTSTSTANPIVAPRSSPIRRRAIHSQRMATRPSPGGPRWCAPPGSWRRASRTVARTRIAARTTVGTRPRAGTTTTGAGTGGSPDDVSVANGSTSHASTSPRQRAEDQARGQQRDVLDREPQQQLARREAQRLEQRELAEPLRDRHRRADEEADRREHEGRERPEARGSR